MDPASAGAQPAFRALDAQVRSCVGAAPSRSLHDVVLHHLRTREEIDSIVFLRDEIDLSVHTAAGASFEILEKKETNAASCAASSSPENG